MKKILLLIVSVFMTGSLVYGQTGKVIHINQSEFIEKVYDYKKNPDKWVYEGSKPAIIDFYADWCGPCKMLSPVVDEIAGESDAYRVCKLNVDDAPEIAARYRVMSIPTLIVFKNGEEVDRSVGALPKARLQALLKKHL